MKNSKIVLLCVVTTMTNDIKIKLVGKKLIIPNDIGEPTITKNITEIFAERQSIGLSEFYQASANGFKPEIAFLIYRFEYHGEKTIIYNNERYNVIRTADIKSNGDKIKIICNAIVGDTHATS